MYMGDKTLAAKLRSMTPDQVREFWKVEQARKREAGEAYHTVLYAAATGPDQDKVVARLDA